MATIGYARVSTEEQNEARQLEMMKAYGLDFEPYVDKMSGKNTDRPQLKAMLNFVRKGDTLIVESISRLARSVRDLLEIVDELEKKGVTFVSKKEAIDTSTPQGRFMLTVFGAMAELEREQILERQKEGIEIAKREGKYKGRKPLGKPENFDEVVATWREGKISAVEAMKRTGLAKATFYRMVKAN